MNFNKLSTSLLFISPSFKNSTYKAINSQINDFNKLESSFKPCVYVPTQTYKKHVQVHDPLNQLNKNPQFDSDIVTYTGYGLEFCDIVKIPTNDDLISSICNSKPLINTLNKVFDMEAFNKLNEYQSSLFDELASGRDVIMHSYTSSGKTFSVLLYMVLRYYYQFPTQCLTSKSFSEIINLIKTSKNIKSPEFKRKYSPINSRILVLCPTMELAVQSAKQIMSFMNGKEDYVKLIIDDNNSYSNITPKNIFIVGSSNQVESYFLKRDSTHVRSVLQTIDYVFLDEMDRLIKVSNQYANKKRKKIVQDKPGSAFNICQTLLSISPNKLRFVGASASVSRRHIRKINSLIHLYRKNKSNFTAVIRKKQNATETGRYVSVPNTIEHYYSVTKKDTLGSKVKKLVKMLNYDKGIPVVFLSNGSLLKLRDELNKHNLECKLFHHELGIKDNVNKEEKEKEKNKGKYINKDKEDVKEEMNDNNIEMITKLQNNLKENKLDYILIASTDSCRGIHLSELDSVYILGKPRNVNEYIHLAGRVGRVGRKGRCITIDTMDNIKILLSWQKHLNTNIRNVAEKNRIVEVNSNVN